MGRLREACGAFTGALIVLGYLKGNDSTDIKRKEKLYKNIQNFAKEFEKENGSYTCRVLLGLHGKSKPKPSKRNPKFYHSRPCLKYVGSAAKLISKYLK